MKNKNRAIVLFAVIVSCLACCFVCSKNSFAVQSISAVYEQAWNGTEGNLKILETLKPTDIVLNPNKTGVFEACKDYIDNYDENHPEINNSTRLIWHGKDYFNKYFSCQHKTKTGTTNLVFDGENWGESYNITTRDLGKTNKDIDYNTSVGPNEQGEYPSFTIISPDAAVDVAGGKTYDLHMTIYDIRVKTRVCDGNASGSDSSTVVALLYGWTPNKDNMASHKNVAGYSYMTGKSLEGKSNCRGGAIYKVKIELYDGDTQVRGKRMLWAVNDIDIGDRFKGADSNAEYAPGVWEYAEHLKFLRDENNDIYGATEDTYISMVDILDGKNHDGCSRSKRNEQELVFENDTIFHNIYTSGGSYNHCVDSEESGSTNDNSTSALFVVDITDFRFEWGGSKCGTTIDSAPYSEFGGKTVIEYNGSEVESGSTITVNSGTSKTIAFKHFLRREFGTSSEEDEKFQVIRKDWKYNSTYDGLFHFTLSHKTDFQPVYDTLGSDYVSAGVPYRATLSPGQSLTYSHELKYQRTSVNSSSSKFVSVGEKSITVQRPQATFTGSVAPSVNSTAVANNSSIKITSTDGSYAVSFVNTIKRNADTAGDMVSSWWKTWVEKTTDGRTTKAEGDHSGAADRTEGESKSSDIQSYVISGNLRYGESITYCGKMDYQSIKNVSMANGGATATATACVTVYRDNARCEFDSSFEYGVNYATNTGRIGVQNKSLANNPTYTTPYTNMSVSIFARPTDNIRFTYDMCAGVLYPVQKRSLNTTITYKATGESTKLNTQNNGYLFRDSVSVVDGTFYNPRFWTNQNDGHNYGFLRTRVEDGFWSPNNAVNKNYRCGSDTETGHYQIAGKEDCGRSGVYDIGVIDAGSTITQKLEWNEQTYRYNDGRNTFADSPRAASASVVIPYNYILKPFVTNESANVGKVAYIGESLTMTPGVVTTARKNTAFPSSKQTYATITKPTEIKVKYYFKTSSGSVISESEVTSSSRSQYRLNKNGLINGTVTTEDKKSVDDGGTLLPSVKVQIPNTGVGVGDKVCVEVSVSPADSHDARDASSVNGGGDGGEALRETTNGSSWATSVSCSTIAKKPSMSVESSNAYSATEFKTANYARTIGSKKFNFGSWSEYGVFGRVLTEQSSLFASGAAYGYSRDGYTASAAQTANVSRANDDASATGNKVSTTTNSSKCTFMTQTFANANCNSSSTSIGGVMASQYEQRIKERFSSNSGSFEIVGLATKQYNNATYYNVSGYSGSDVIVAPSGIVRFDSKYNLYINALPNISNEQFAAKGIERPNHTIVYSAPDKNIVIDGDLGYNGGNIAGADSITQVIIIAKNVYFTSAPTYINAVIIANEVNTCRFVGANKVAVGGKGSAGTIDSTQCNQALRFDAPVIVKKLILNRTFGAGNGDDAIRRAEIFNFNMANYLWSFNQMTRLSQATTTYSRELPTRY